MSAGQLTVAVSEFAGDAVAITRENVLAHEQVVRSVLRHTTPLPFVSARWRRRHSYKLSAVSTGALAVQTAVRECSSR